MVELEWIVGIVQVEGLIGRCLRFTTTAPAKIPLTVLRKHLTASALSGYRSFHGKTKR